MRVLFLLPILCLLVLSGCRREDGALYKDQLLEAIRTADAIHVTEHSSRFDRNDGVDAPFRIYRELTLPRDAVEDFHREIIKVPSKTKDYLTACIFEDHHTIRFKKGGQTTSTMRICFKCHQIEWDGSPCRPPLDLLRHLDSFLSRHGFQPERDWRALALAPP
ncbi:hypothetical protein OVA24_16890 [Luteolibacter sp. SL250]|uniref:hypothetical protein n=1 Tax=Luteolibacter sp. SL250 TaxID=2995170 RepID=UPI00227192F8|nr:hypothetical protein [Luteolibacter sp. SL250]WAC18910.1 hypothetical protein OVA24_16890 [Luteolibacter sp. SL250]